ncbi:hypothetical protein B4O83_08440 [Chromohalobacter israelensis]|nr:hypothetical protein B4O83_08440 [Chromohalobacter salexigens]
MRRGAALVDSTHVGTDSMRVEEGAARLEARAANVVVIRLALDGADAWRPLDAAGAVAGISFAIQRLGTTI